MISLTILELLYLVLTMFIVVIGTLLTVVLLRLLKILKVGTELADMYFSLKEMLANLALLPDMLKEKFMKGEEDELEEQGESSKKESD